MATMNHYLRQATPDDEPFLCDMLFYAANMAQDGTTSSAAARSDPFLHVYLDDWGRAGDMGVIAETAEGQPIGAAWIRQFNDPAHSYGGVDPSTPELAIAVHPSVIGHGVGSAMLHQLCADASAVYQAIVLSVREENPARRLYERCGFRVIDTWTNRVGGRSFLMLWRRNE